MKKYLLSLITLFMVAIGIKAEVLPTFSAPAEDGETVQYLFNVETKAFLLGANDWNTRASVNPEKGYQIKAKKNANDLWTINDYVETKNAWLAMFCDNPNSIWVDNLSGANVNAWEITSIGDGKYEITNSAAGAGKLGVNDITADSRLYLGATNTTWAFVNADDYNQYLIDAAEEIAKEKQAKLDEANKAAIAAREDLVAKTNIWNLEGLEAYNAKTAEYAALVEAGGYTETVVNPNAATGWHASTAYNFLLTPWTVGGEAANDFAKALYINTWSTEGSNDGSKFLVPFFEYWIGDAESLKSNTLATTVSGLTPNANCTVSAWVRVRIKNGGGNDAKGIVFSAGGDTISVCAGDQVGETQFRIMKAEVNGKADAEGNLVIAFDIAADNNISWLSYKDVYYAEAAPAPVVAIEEGEGVYTVTSTSADAALYYLCKPMSWLDEGETPESCLQADIEGMGSMVDSEETWEMYAHMGMQPAPKAFNLADYMEEYEGQEMFLIAANVGWNGEKLAVISNIEQVNFTITAPFISGAAVLVNGKETSLNTHSEVSAEQADAVSAQVSPAVRQVFYDLRYMMEIPGEEGSLWIATDTIDTDEMSINGTAYAELNWPLAFEAGSKYMLTIRALDMDQNEESVSFIINGSYVEPLLANHNFAEGNVGEVNIATYAKDGTPNQMQEVPGWTIGVENGDARAAGVVAYGSKTTLGGATYGVPAEGPEGTNGNALAVVGVWTGTVKYVQNAVLPAGKYTMTVPVYNTAGTTAFIKNLIGVKYGETEVLATATSYPVGKWTNEIVVFELEEETTVTVSLGYEGANVASAAAQHLFYDRVDIEPYDELAVAKATAIAALPAAGEGIFCVSQEEIDAAVAAIEAAESVEEVEAVAVTIPALEGEWTIYNTTAENYLGTSGEASIVLSADPVSVTFEKAEGGFYIKIGEEYVSMTGTGNNVWSMGATAEAKTSWKFNLTDGNYTIQGANGVIGTDNTDAGSACYANKTADKNGIWTIAKAAVDYGITFDVEEGAEISLDSVKSIHVSIATPEGLEASNDLFIQGTIFGKDGTNQPIFGFTDFEDGIDVDISRLTPGNAYIINITKIAYGKEVGFDEETYMPIYEHEITAAEGEALATLNFAIAVPEIEAPEISGITVNPNKQIIAMHFDAEDAAPTYNVSFALETAEGIAVNTTVAGDFGQDYGDMIYTFGGALTDGNYVLVLPAGSMTFSLDGTPFNAEIRVPFTVGEGEPEPTEIAVSLIAEDETEYALNTHSVVTVDMPIAGIKVTGLDQIMDTVTYAILGKDKTTVASGILSVNTIGYAEFVTLVSLYEGNDYQIVVATKDSILADMQVIGAAEAPEIEIAATLNGEVAINTHSEVSVEKANEIEVTFDGVIPTEAGYIICKMKNVESEEGLLWEVDEELEHGMLSLNGKGYAEFEEIHRFAVGTKYLIVVAYSTADGKRVEVNFVINGSYDADADAINAIAADAVANGKFIENGKVVIVKDGVKYNAAGQIIR